MDPNALFYFDQFINMTNFYPLFTFRRLPCSSSTGINNRAAGHSTVVMVFASSSGQFYLDVTNSYHLSGLSHLDNFIVTWKSCPLTGLCKNACQPRHPACGGAGSRQLPIPPGRYRQAVWYPDNLSIRDNVMDLFPL